MNQMYVYNKGFKHLDVEQKFDYVDILSVTQ